MNEAETEAQITSQTNLGTGMRARGHCKQFFQKARDSHHIFGLARAGYMYEGFAED
jgi:hypothetical protein